MKKKNLFIWAVLILLGAAALLTAGVWRRYTRAVSESLTEDDPSQLREYRRHYVIIPDDSSSPLWQDLCDAARKAGEEQDAYVELLEDWEAGDYTPLSYMDIAIASAVDGIIIKPDGTERMRRAIQEADEAGIPVVTVIEDDTESSRKTFVGFNNYQLGAAFGGEILKCVDSSTRRITVLFQRGNLGNELIFQNLKTAVLEGLEKRGYSEGERDRLVIESLTISPQSAFESEEVIRDRIISLDTRPDILVCMNETDSESAYNAVVDYNLVGSVTLVGFYQSEPVLDAIEKGTVPASVTLDTEQMGRYIIEALEEYHTMGYTSSYMSVDLHVITKENVSEYRKQDGES